MYPWNKGKHPSRVTRLKMSKAHKGQCWSRASKLKLSKSISGKNHPFYGKHLPKAVRIKISNAHRGKKLSRAHKLKLSKNHADFSGKNNPFWKGGNKVLKARYRKKHPKYGSKAWREKISEALQGRKLSRSHRLRVSKGRKGKCCGKNNPAWNDGSSFKPYTPEFNETLKQEIRKRDNYTCQLCGKRGKYVHHIDYNKKNCKKSNLCLLCVRCNSKVNANRKYWTRFFRKIIRKFKKARKIYTVRNLLN